MNWANSLPKNRLYEILIIQSSCNKSSIFWIINSIRSNSLYNRCKKWKLSKLRRKIPARNIKYFLKSAVTSLLNSMGVSRGSHASRPNQAYTYSRPSYLDKTNNLVLWLYNLTRRNQTNLKNVVLTIFQWGLSYYVE